MAGWPTDKAVSDGAERIEDLLAMLGVDPDGRQTEDVHGVDTPMGDDVKTVVARAAVGAAGLPELVSHGEAREILGTRNPRMPAGTPAPLYGPGGVHPEVGGRSLWLRSDIETFAVEFQARPNVVLRRSS